MSRVHPPEFLALLAIPYLFCMFYGACRLLIAAVPHLDFSPGIAILIRRESMLVACATGLLSTLIALLPLYTYQRDDSFERLFNDGFVGRWILEIGVFLVLYFCIDAAVQRRMRGAQGKRSRIADLLFRAVYVLYTTAIFIGSERWTASWKDDVCFFVCALIISLLLPRESSPDLRAANAQSELSKGRMPAVVVVAAKHWPHLVMAVGTLLLFGVFPERVGILLGSLLVCIAGIAAWTVLLALIFSSVLVARHRLTISVALTAALAALAYYTALDGEADIINTTRANVAVLQEPPAVTPAADFAAWKASRSDTPAIIILAEGGGIRAAYWTAAALETLSLPYVNLINQTYAIIGVSGGALGATAFTANFIGSEEAKRKDPAAFKNVITPPAYAGNLSRSELSSDFIGPWLARVISTEVLQKLTRWRFTSSKGETLQDAWVDSMTCQLDQRGIFAFAAAVDTCAEVKRILGAPLINMSKRPDGTSQPRLIFVATHVESGERMLFSSVNYNPSAFANSIDMESVAPRSVSMISAAHASARFPLVSPPGAVRSDTGQSIGHAVDGGYIDASGALTATELVRAIAAGNSNFHPIIIDLNNNPDDDLDSEATNRKENHTGELQTIFTALQNSNESRRYFVKRQLIDEICDLKGGYISLKVSKSIDGPIGLGWTLSSDAAMNLDRAMTRETTSFAPIPHPSEAQPDSMSLLRKASSVACQTATERVTRSQ
ncbi:MULTISPECIES: patatin-like phospholipase family protein [Burkholderia]|uniref:patatin-like phospholipase family protein n=1 Tax=Burkholderia TaxID=32008 RepID=UPI00119B249C|nr:MULTISPECIES: patatin-like phospholipase family protein [Burkholderia]MBU9170872.1 patatin-like phospholipase family protein [Burkholderia gladioli]TWC62505.1 patatin-like phospholipase [Burkholderia sp. SJZ089]TWC95755.1 patatin-like phospholipase [Burkholderia sp. SJZ115]TWC99062.1 patatin-like phospholipase [Burkholderia sp. SJZ091]